MLHPPPIGELVDDEQSLATPGCSVSGARGEPRAVVEHAAADVAACQQLERHGDVIRDGAAHDAVRDELADHQLDVIYDVGRQARGQSFRDDPSCLGGTLRPRVDLVEGANA